METKILLTENEIPKQWYNALAGKLILLRG